MNPFWLSFLPSVVRERLSGRTELQSIISNTGWLFYDKIIRMVGAVTIGVWMARYLGPRQYGALNFAMAYVALFGALSSLGLDGIAIRTIVREPARKNEILASAFFLKLGGSVVASVAALASIFVIRPTDSQAQLLVAIIAAGILFSSFDVIDLWFQSQVLSKYSVYAKNAAYLLQLLAKIALIVNQAPVAAFAWVMLGEYMVAGMGLVIIYHATHQSMGSWRPHFPTALKLLRESWPLMLSGLAVMFSMRIDQVMLGQMVGDREVGVYAAVLRFSEIWYFIPWAIVSSIAPNLTETKMVSETQYYEKLQKLLNLLARIAIAIALPMTLVATPIMVFFCGAPYASGGAILAIHIWAAVFVFIGTGATPWIINERLPKLSLFQAFLGVIVNVGLNFILIPRLGGVGAAIATLVAQSVSVFFSNMAFPLSRRMFFMQARAIFRFGL